MYTIEQFKKLNRLESIVVTRHSRIRFVERNISIDDVRNAIESGEIIEDYPDDFPFPSCLINGISGERKIHIVASIDDNYIYIITAYVPDDDNWESDAKTRKESLEK